MKILIPENLRKDELIKFGAPQALVENVGNISELKYRVENVDSAYYYLPTISNYKILKNLNIIPIFGEGDTFWVFGYNDRIQKIFYFELENDKIYRNYGTNWSGYYVSIF